MNNPSISIIIATYNAGETLQKCIDSIAAQTYEDYELIIIDGGSTDNTTSIIKENSQVISHWLSEKDEGIYDAWNKGLAKAKGDWMCFLGADDYLWKNDVLTLMASYLKSQAISTRLVYGKVALLNSFDEHICSIGAPWRVAGPKFHYTMSVPHPGTMHRRSLFQEHGTFDKSFRIAGDYELLLRELKNKQAGFLPMIMVGMRQGGVSSNPKNSLLMLKELRRAQIKHKQRLSLYWMLALTRVYIRVSLWKIVGDRKARRLLDIGRMIMGEAPYWTKLK